MSTPPPLTYRDAGVDIDAGDQLVENIKPFAKRTMRPEVLAGIGGFGALVEVSKKYKNPVLVAGTDGVGTKLKLAFATGRHATIGIDLVAMSVNDILVQGAEPLFFLDYFACGKLDVDTAATVIGGIATGCEQSGCALLGGETAEMPGMYPPGEFDLAGFAVGVVEKGEIIDGSGIAAGDQLIGLASSGPHSNGYSLIRRVLEKACGDITPASLARMLEGRPLADWVMAPTRIYVKPLLSLIRGGNGQRATAGQAGEAGSSGHPALRNPVKGMAHITGGGLLQNVPRMLPPALRAAIRGGAWEQPAIFQWLQAQGGIAASEMHRVFNCGIGMVLAVAATDVDRAMKSLALAGETAFHLGEIETRPPGTAATVIV
ncbi:MAG: phosphoribosylformylglycinamidine cyclo-ligase [Lautropia sp.]|nr:phosphoribosylformylglycinamidine cyclo-ligase [Lautropia sp.]